MLQNKMRSLFVDICSQYSKLTCLAFVSLTGHVCNACPFAAVSMVTSEPLKRHNYSSQVLPSSLFLRHFQCLVMAAVFPVSVSKTSASEISDALSFITNPVLCLQHCLLTNCRKTSVYGAKNFIAVDLYQQHRVVQTCCPSGWSLVLIFFLLATVRARVWSPSSAGAKQ